MCTEVKNGGIFLVEFIQFFRNDRVLKSFEEWEVVGRKIMMLVVVNNFASLRKYKKFSYHHRKFQNNQTGMQQRPTKSFQHHKILSSNFAIFHRTKINFVRYTAFMNRNRLTPRVPHSSLLFGEAINLIGHTASTLAQYKRLGFRGKSSRVPEEEPIECYPFCFLWLKFSGSLVTLSAGSGN